MTPYIVSNQIHDIQGFIVNPKTPLVKLVKWHFFPMVTCLYVSEKANEMISSFVLPSFTPVLYTLRIATYKFSDLVWASEKKAIEGD